MITIVPPRGGDDASPMLGNGTKFFLPDGREITDVAFAEVRFAPDEVVRAVVEVAVGEVPNVSAHPLLSLDSLRAAADHYGLVLVSKEQADKINRLFEALEALDAPPEPEEAPLDPVAAHRARTLAKK